MKGNHISRQRFIKMACLGAGCLSLSPLLAGCGNATNQPTSPASPTLEGSPTGGAGYPASTSAGVGPTQTISAGEVTAPIPSTAISSQKPLLSFPAGFRWGTATSAYQVEGAAREDGRGTSIWDTFCASNRCNGDTGAVAADHYHLWQEDLDLMKTLGFQTYRFSIAWPRVMPGGSGAINQKGLDFYKRLVDGLNKRNIVPMATLYHWDLPQALENKGGWTNRDTAAYFARYSEEVFKALGSEVPLWATINEPWVTANLGYGSAIYAPGRTGKTSMLKAVHYQLLGHGLAVQAFRAQNLKNTEIGIVLNTAPVYPLSETDGDKKAAVIEDGNRNRLYLDPILKGSYPADTLAYWNNQGVDFSFVLPQDLKAISQPIEFLGVNYYNPVYVMAGVYGSYQTVPGPHPHAQLDWEEIYPDGLYNHLVRLKNDYGNIPLYITENGAAYIDKPDSVHQVNDFERLKYLHDHFVAAHQAIAQGVNLKGYYVWSFIDNFEWTAGYSVRFGIVYVDFQSQKRYPKRSALWYSDVIKQNGVGELPGDN